MRRKHTAADWSRLIKEFKGSQMSQAQFVASRGIKLTTFQYWLYRTPTDSLTQSSGSTKSQFLPVQLKSTATASLTKTIIDGDWDRDRISLTMGPLQFEFSRGADPGFIADLAHALLQRC